jgi:hypothetical protein
MQKLLAGTVAATAVFAVPAITLRHGVHQSPPPEAHLACHQRKLVHHLRGRNCTYSAFQITLWNVM